MYIHVGTIDCGSHQPTKDINKRGLKFNKFIQYRVFFLVADCTFFGALLLMILPRSKNIEILSRGSGSK
jgi:hypothetical protein